MARQWTPEAKAEMAEKMKQRWADRKEKASQTATEVEAQLNPVANDVILPAVTKKKPRPIPPVHPPKPIEPQFSVTSVVSQLESIPLGAVSYADCGTLLNALAAASTAVALARRQKQEQLEAGTHRAPCKTCGRMIDISKPGGFQILTERDEHHMPMNVFFCSQHCLLAKNMPSHAKQTPKQKMENRA
jgi:hypothetical protein